MNVTLVLAAIDVAVLVLFGGFLLNRIVISPIRRLASTSERIAAGDYATRAEGGAGSELDQLASSFNKMVDGILEAQERLRRSGQEMARSEKLATVGRLAAGVAHEVGSPLMAIRAYAEHLLRHRPGREESEECLGKVIGETRKIEQIVHGLLSVASPGGGREGATDINAVVRNTIEMVSFRDLFREVEVALDCAEVPAAAILEDRFRQVLLNLVLNAVDAMGGKGLLTVRTWTMENWNPAAGKALQRRATDPQGMDAGFAAERRKRRRTRRGGLRRRHGRRDPGGGPSAGLRSVLHHQGAREGDGARAVGVEDDRRRRGGRDPGRERGGERDDLHRHPAAGEEGRGAGEWLTASWWSTTRLP